MYIDVNKTDMAPNITSKCVLPAQVKPVRFVPVMFAFKNVIFQKKTQNILINSYLCLVFSEREPTGCLGLLIQPPPPH